LVVVTHTDTAGVLHDHFRALVTIGQNICWLK
jgi:hypothetical protein